MLLPGALGDAAGLKHLRRAHVLLDVPAKEVAELQLAGCRWCDTPLRTTRTRGSRASLAAHVVACLLNPRRWLRPAPSTAAAGVGQGETLPGVAGRDRPSSPAAATDLFASDLSAWERARRTFLATIPATAAGWAPFVASPARTLPAPPPALRRAWQLLGADALARARRAPEQPLAWLWVLLLPSLLLHHPAPSAAVTAAPLTHSARAAALLSGDFEAALADREVCIWRSNPRPAERQQRPTASGGASAATDGPVTTEQRRALRLVLAGRLSAPARALTAAPVAPRTPAVWTKALGLFPPARPGLATTSTVEAEFPAALAAAAAFSQTHGVPTALPRAAADEAIRRAPRGSAPGISGLRMEHLRALGDEGQAALAGVVILLAGEAAVRLVPAVAAHALAGAELLLLCTPGGDDVDGLPWLRPIGMPEVLRKLAASALAGTVRGAAARLLAPLQMGVGVPNPCERVVHEVGAELVHRPSALLLQLDFRDAFNLVSMQAAVAYLLRAFPLLRPHIESVYLDASAPRVYGWVDDAAAADAAAGSPSRLWLAVQRGVQQGDTLGPLLHAAATQLALLRLAAAHPSAVVRAVHDDVVVVASLEDMPVVLTTAAAAGAAVDAELAPAKRAAWSPAGAPAPAGWPARWHDDGVRQLSIPIGTDSFVATAVDTLAADHRRLTEAIVALPRGELQSQLLLIRMCAGPQPNYWLRALPLVWGARLAASVDRAAQGAVRRLLTDARDAPAVVDALLARAALPVSHGSLGIGGRTAIVPAAALASRVDALRAGRQYSPAPAAVADFLIAADGAVPTSGTPAPPPSAGERVSTGRLVSPPTDGAPARLPGAAATAPALGASSGSAPNSVALAVVAGGRPVAVVTPLAVGSARD